MPAVNPPPAPSSFAYAAGDVIAGKYALEALLGEGGMGAVFRARNTAIDMPVALKLIRADLNRELLGERLLQEARAAAKLSHPAIVRVFDVGQTALGDPFIVMELLEGETLASIMDREGRLPATRAVQLLLPIADALSAAHAKGFVHRDVKPDNVFVVAGEGSLQPKLVDFGIVKQDSRDGDHHITSAGAVMGSPDYMSPEQARGLENVDLRSDIWSFAVVLYEAVSGETPFTSPNYNALLRMIVETEPKTLKERFAADDQLSAIVSRGLSKDPAARYNSLGAMGKALARWLVDQGLSQDVCGVSLESKWLSRRTDADAAAPRSAPARGSEPLPGTRSAERGFGTASTVHAHDKAPATHGSLAPIAATRESAPAFRWGAPATAVAALATAGLVWLGLFREPQNQDAAASATGTPASSASVAPAAVRVPPPAPSIAPALALSAAAPSVSAAKATPERRAPAAKIKPSRTSRPAPSDPKSELLAPY